MQDKEQHHDQLDRLTLDLPGTEAPSGSAGQQTEGPQPSGSSRPRKKRRVLRFLL